MTGIFDVKLAVNFPDGQKCSMLHVEDRAGHFKDIRYNTELHAQQQYSCHKDYDLRIIALYMHAVHLGCRIFPVQHILSRHCSQ